MASGRPLTAVVLAAGLGTRMKSSVPKVLHPLAGRPMVLWTLHALAPLDCERAVVVVGHGAEEVIETIDEGAPEGLSVVPVEQPSQKGTGDATSVALRWLEKEFPDEGGDILVINGDGPTITSETLAELVLMHTQAGYAATLLSARLEDPSGYGRIVRDGDGRIVGVVEDADCGPEEAAIDEVNAGFYCFSRPQLGSSLDAIAPNNEQGEHYLPDAVRILVDSGESVEAFTAPAEEVMGVNSRAELAAAEAILRERINAAHMERGVSLIDPTRTYIDVDVSIAQDTTIYPGTLIQGESAIGEACLIGPDTQIVDSVVGPRSRVTYSVVRESTLGEEVSVGPYAYIRPATKLKRGVHVGASVELKASEVGEGSKIPHLSYIGDAEIGAGVNIGAGTITCNYDGVEKHRTIVEDGARIGSDTMLVAPVKVGKGAYTAAGSAITDDVPDGALAVGRGEQKNIEGWVARHRPEEGESG